MSGRLVLASTSRYRRELLERLRLPFDVARPDVDETPLPGETPAALARRLACAKAAAVAGGTDGWVIGSDQVASLEGHPLGKPDSVEGAHEQLRRMSGQAVEFLTAVCLAHRSGHTYQAIDTTTVRFRVLDDATIARYIEAEQPLDCAGSFKSEGLGIALFDAIETVDPTALVGLPLIATARLLRQAGFSRP
jgi:septum formation protein